MSAVEPGPLTGVLVMAYGTPASYEDVEAFYTDVRRGRAPTPEQLADLRRRYAAVGGTSELATRTAEQVAGIEQALERRAPGRYSCRYGSKHAAPRIEEAVAELATVGAQRLVGIVLAPHYSKASVGEYVERARAQAEAEGLQAEFVEDWHDNSVLVELLAERVLRAYAEAGADPGDPGTVLLVTAHSLPLRVIESGDGYDVRLGETAELVASAVGAANWRVCWQSAGRTPEPWSGPDILEVIRALPSEGIKRAIVCPAGFTSDHLEVSYDVDIEAKMLAESVGVDLVRSASLNADARLCDALAELVSEAADRFGA